MILNFQMNHLTTVEALEKGLWRITTRTDDNLFSAELTLDVKAPALNILDATITVKRDALGLAPDLSAAAEKLTGVRVGPGMTKIVRGIIAGEGKSPRIAEMTLEAMEMLINAITVPELRKAMVGYGEEIRFERDGPEIFLNNVVIGDEHTKIMAENPRLKDSCIAFRDL